MTGAGRAAIHAEGVIAGYGDMEILHGVDVRVEPGEVVTIIGPNGCGKSTLLRAIAGLLRPWRGRILLGARDVTRASPRERFLGGLAYVPQVRGIFSNMTTRENVQMGLHGMAGARLARDTAVRGLLPSLTELWSRPAGRLSGGQQQTVALARALVSQPKALLLDEPSAGLSPKAADEMFATIRRISETQKMALLLVEQNARKALAISDRCYVMAEGTTRLEGPAAEILANADVGRLYLGG